MASKIIDRDFGYRKLLQELTKRIGKHVVVGFTADAGNYPDGTPVTDVAAIHEFGAPGAGIPERSFLRSTMDQNVEKYAKALERALTDIADGKGDDVERVLAQLGAKAEGDIKLKIRNLRTPPNAPSTIRQKGSSNPLIDTGQMRQAVTFEVRDND